MRPIRINPQAGPLQAESAAPGKGRRLGRRLAGALILVLAVLGLLYVFRAGLLTGLAEAWVVSQPAAKADAIVVLGGGLEDRPEAAAKLFRKGVAPRILYMNVQCGPAESMGILPPESELTRRILLSNNVPETAMEPIGTNVASTYDESRAVRKWALQTGATSIEIVTDLFHTRRARWIFNRELRGTKVAVHVVAVTPPRYVVGNWWRHEEGLVAFQSEMVKYLYYRLRY